MFTLQPTLGCLCAELLCREWAPDCMVSPPQMQTCACSCLTQWGSCEPLSPACWRASEPSSVMSAHPTLGFCEPFYWEFTVSHHSHCSGIISPLLICEGSHLVTGCTLNSVLLIICLHLAFFTYLLIFSSGLYLSNLVIRKLWDTVLKAQII